MNSSTTINYLAAFGLGYSLTTIKDKIICEDEKLLKHLFLNKFESQFKTFEVCYSLIFDELLEIPLEYISDSHIADFTSSLFELTEEKVSNHINQNLQLYFFAGGVIYLSDRSGINFEKKKFKYILYEMLSKLGNNVTWEQVDILTSELYGKNMIVKRAAKKQIIDFMFSSNLHEEESLELFHPQQIYNSLLV